MFDFIELLLLKREKIAGQQKRKLKSFYEKQRAYIKQQLGINNNKDDSQQQKLRTRFREKMKQLSKQSVLKKKESGIGVSSLRVAWRRLKTQIKEQEEKFKIQQQQSSSSSSEEKEEQEGKSKTALFADRRKSISSFVNIRRRVLHQNASDLISFLRSEEALASGTKKKEEISRRLQEIFIRQKDKIRDRVSKLQAAVRENQLKRQQMRENNNNNATTSSSSSASPEAIMVTQELLPVKAVTIDEDNLPDGVDTEVKNSHVIVACPDQHNNIHNLAIDRNSDCFGQLLLCNPLAENFSLQMGLWFVVRRSAARVWVTTPYFLPHRKLVHATIEAAKRGVDVRVLTGSKATTDPWLMWYAQQYLTHRLLKSGVKLYEYHGGAVMHAKTVVVDGVWSSVGSYNWDILSNKLMEASFTALDPKVAAEMEQQFENDLLKSEHVVEDTFLQRPMWVRVCCRIIYYGLKISEMISFRGYGHRDLTSNID
jgi:hypothetical protein